MDQTNNNAPGGPVRKLVCGNCGRAVNVRLPKMSGNYKVSCPSCQAKIPFEVMAASVSEERKVLKADMLDDRVISRGLPKNINSNDNLDIPVLGTPLKSEKRPNLYYVKHMAQANKQYKIFCAECGEEMRLFPRMAGQWIKTKCPNCDVVVVYKTKDAAPDQPLMGVELPPVSNEKQPPAHPVQQPPALPGQQPPALPGQQPPALPGQVQRGPNGTVKTVMIGSAGKVEVIAKPNGYLSWKSNSTLKRTNFLNLKEGRTIIGRTDETKISDLMIDGDPEMSRRSVEIMVRRTARGDFDYELRVISSTNPVLVNGRPVGINNFVKLNFGDTICMGRTNLYFNKR